MRFDAGHAGSYPIWLKGTIRLHIWHYSVKCSNVPRNWPAITYNKHRRGRNNITTHSPEPTSSRYVTES